MEAIGVYANAVSRVASLEPLSSKGQVSVHHGIRPLRLGLTRTSRRDSRVDLSVNAGLVDGLVDEILKITKDRHPGGRLSLFPAQSESVLSGMLASAAAVIDKKAAVIHKREPVSLEKPVLMDSIRQGRMIENLLLYRQTFVIRSYEVGADKTASIETLMNLFQETALNHVRLSGIGGDGFGTTKAMILNGLIWVVSRMHVEVDRYPAWGEVVEMDSWVAPSGKNGMRRDWVLRNVKTRQVYARATSTWVMMHQRTRKLSKMPPDVRAEISPYFRDRNAIQDESSLKINKLQDESALYETSNLQARRTDLDMNQHVNNVKYIGWMMESVPDYLHKLEIKSITLEYRRECGQADLVKSLTSPERDSPLGSTSGGPGPSRGGVEEQVIDPEFPYLSGSKLGVRMLTGHNGKKSLICEPAEASQFTHLLKMQSDGAEIVRGRTIWGSKGSSKQLVSKQQLDKTLH